MEPIKKDNPVVQFPEVPDKVKRISLDKSTKGLITNLLSAILFFLVTIFCNLFLDGEFEYSQIFSWNIGLLVLINWVCGITISFCLRQSGINSAKLTKSVMIAEKNKVNAFNTITDFAFAQRKLNYLSAVDFENRRIALADSIGNLVKHLMPEGEKWGYGKKLPPKTPLKIHNYLWHLKKMTPQTPSLTGLAQYEGSFSTRGAYEIAPAVDKTGIRWFVTKAGGKIGWFALAPIILSIMASMLVSGEVTLGSIVTAIGTLAIMMFNGGKAYTGAYYDVTIKGVARDEHIVRVIESVNKSQLTEEQIAAYFSNCDTKIDKKTPEAPVAVETPPATPVNVSPVAATENNNAEVKHAAPPPTEPESESIKKEQPE